MAHNYHYYITYVYGYDGLPYEHTQLVSERHFNRFHKGQSVSIAIMPKAPHVAQLVGNDADSSRITTPAISGMVGLFMTIVFVLAYVFHWYKKQNVN